MEEIYYSFFSVVKNYMPGAMGSDLSELLPARN